jgi:two-component system sensor histidine kinase CpxA
MAERLTNFVSGQKRFLGDISHELSSPIARLQIALELLSEAASENQSPLISDIREEVEEMTNLVNELLAFSKAGLKGMDLNLTIVNPKLVVLDLIDRMSLKDKVILQFSDEPEVIADPLLLSRAFSNILRNSLRYAGERGPITISAERQVAQVAVIFSDCGPGVSDEALKRLTDPFFRPEASRSRSSGGVGLGLAIVKTCVEACNGTLLLRNKPGGGFEVEIRLNQAS